MKKCMLFLPLLSRIDLCYNIIKSPELQLITKTHSTHFAFSERLGEYNPKII